MSKPDAVRAALAELVEVNEIRRDMRVDLNEDSYKIIRARSEAAWTAARAALAEQPAEPSLIEFETAHRIAFQAAAAFRPSYFGPNFRAHTWVVEAIRSAHMDGQRFAAGGPVMIDRFPGGPTPAKPAPHPAPSVAVPEGWQLVPAKATEDMLFAAEMSAPRGYSDLYCAMLAASPQPPTKQEGS